MHNPASSTLRYVTRRVNVAFDDNGRGIGIHSALLHYRPLHALSYGPYC